MNRDELRASIESAYANVKNVLDSMPVEGWEQQTGTEDHWTVRDTIGHLATGTRGNIQIAQAIVEGRDLFRPDFDLARYNRRNIEKSAQLSGADQSAAFDEAYAQTISYLNTLSDDQLAAPGRRTTGEETTVGGVFERIADHMKEHLKEITDTVVPG